MEKEQQAQAKPEQGKKRVFRSMLDDTPGLAAVGVDEQNAEAGWLLDGIHGFGAARFRDGARFSGR